MKTIIIDGNNLIHKVAHLKKAFEKDKSAAQISLVESILSRASKNERVIFVFDGHDNFKKSNVIFSKDKTADELIRKKIEDFSQRDGSKNHKKIKVVSSDYDIINLAKVCGVEVQKSEDFWSEMNKTESVTEGKNINQNYIYDKLDKPERMSKREIDEFQKYFT